MKTKILTLHRDTLLKLSSDDAAYVQAGRGTAPSVGNGQFGTAVVVGGCVSGTCGPTQDCTGHVMM